MTDATISGAPETKGSPELGSAFEEFMTTFEAFKEAVAEKMQQ